MQGRPRQRREKACLIPLHNHNVPTRPTVQINQQRPHPSRSEPPNSAIQPTERTTQQRKPPNRANHPTAQFNQQSKPPNRVNYSTERTTQQRNSTNSAIHPTEQITRQSKSNHPSKSPQQRPPTDQTTPLPLHRASQIPQKTPRQLPSTFPQKPSTFSRQSIRRFTFHKPSSTPHPPYRNRYQHFTNSSASKQR